MKNILCVFLALMLPAAGLPAKTVVIPFGTTIFCELDQAVTTRQKEAHAVQSGDIVRAHVWKDVWVDGHVVIPAGTPVYAKVDSMKKARLAGQKGDLVIDVVSVQLDGGRDIPVDGGYDRSGKGRMGVTIGLAVAIAWPFVFIKGKNVFLEPGTIFDAMVRAATEVELPAGEPARPPVAAASLSVTVPYSELDLDKKIRELPLVMHYPEQVLERARIVTVNGEEIQPIQVRLVGDEGEDAYRGVVDFKALSRHFERGMNRFEVEMGDERAEVVLEIEF